MRISNPTNEVSQGAIALRRFATREIRARIGVKQDRSIRFWKSGARIPSDLARYALETEFGIARGAWFLKASEPPRAPGLVLNADELAKAKLATDAIREALATLDLTDAARSTLTELGNDLARSILITDRVIGATSN